MKPQMDAAGVKLVAISVGKHASHVFHWVEPCPLMPMLSTAVLLQTQKLTLLCNAGVPEKGKVFCEKVPFPEELFFLDPDRVAYRELSLYEGIGRTFFSAATPKVQLI